MERKQKQDVLTTFSVKATAKYKNKCSIGMGMGDNTIEQVSRPIVAPAMLRHYLRAGLQRVWAFENDVRGRM